MALIYTILFFVFIAFVGYKIYIDWFYITKKRTFNKSEDAINWYFSLNPFNKFMLNIFKKKIIHQKEYKILNDNDPLNNGKSR